MFGESESSLNSGLVIQTADLQSLCQLHFTHHLFVHPPPMVPAHLVASAQRLLWVFQHSPSRGPRTLILACRPIERRRSRVRCLHALESVEPDAVFRDTSTRGTLKSLNNRSHASTLPPLAVFQLCVKTVRLWLFVFCYLRCMKHMGIHASMCMETCRCAKLPRARRRMPGASREGAGAASARSCRQMTWLWSASRRDSA